MSFEDGHRFVSNHPSFTLLPLSNRTLHHPSFYSLYMVSDFEQPYTQGYNQTVHPIIQEEWFYTDPTMSCGRRIPNLVTELEAFNCFQLNTPPPLMSTCQAPPVRPDPFRSRPHPTGDLGSLTLKIDGLEPSAQTNQLILEVTQEEDDTITSLLKLHHQEPLLPNEASSLGDEGRCWSESELEAADTLSNGFGLMEEDEMCGESDKKSAESPARPVGSNTFQALVTPDWAQSDISFCDEEDDGGKSVSEDLCSDSEGDAVHVLLSLGDVPLSQ